MKARPFLSVPISVAVLAGMALAGIAQGQDPSAGDGTGWTGITNPEDVILARQALMTEIERLMRPIDSFAAGDAVDSALLASAAVTLSQVLPAVAHLFPPTTNLYDPEAEAPVTIALPAIWEDFPAFYALAAVASESAAALAATSQPEASKAASLNLRGTCDACHAVFLRPYVAGSVSDEDLQFDFDGFFEQVESVDTDPDTAPAQ
jgi:cytochrome c556